MCFRIALVFSLVGAVAGERSLIADMDAVLVNAPPHVDRQEPVVLMAEKHPAKFMTYESYDFHTTPQADQLMQQLNAQEEWLVFLSELNGNLTSERDQVVQNPRGLRLAAQFNSDAHSQVHSPLKLQGWKVTFYTHFTRTECEVPGGCGNTSRSGNHFLVIEPESSNRFYEKHEWVSDGRRGEWDRACCCKESPNCAGGQCCKFRYGDIMKNGCSPEQEWVQIGEKQVALNPSPSLGKQVDDANCRSGPDVPPFPGWQSAEFID